MPVLREHPHHKGITLPPSGWVLAALLTVYIFVGLIGHDPWKHNDAISIGIAFDLFSHGNWLTPQLAGQPYPDAPLYYWAAALTARAFSWLLPVHDAARLVSGLFTLLALEFILLAARETHGREHAAAAPLILAGSIGFLFHAHEAQPMLAALTAQAAAYWALALLSRRPALAITILGTAMAVGFLANGILPLVALIPAVLLSLVYSDNKARSALFLCFSLCIALLLCAVWLIPLYLTAPDYLATFASLEIAPFLKPAQPVSNIGRYLNLLLWYAWPALPFAAWALWSKRRFLANRPLVVPALSFLAALLALGLTVELRSDAALLLLPPLVLLSVPGFSTLRRGAANAFDWFAMMTFTIFAAIVWVVWSAMVFGWPARLARQVIRLEPGFVGDFSPFFFGLAALATGTWFWLILTSPRSPMRCIMHWMAGLTLFWLLIATLWMPWIDYGKSYRPLSASLTKAIPDTAGCIANANLPDSILATLDYFSDIRTVPRGGVDENRCNLLLILGQVRNPEALSSAGWRKIWEGKRPGDRRESDVFRLYRRQAKGKTPPSLPTIVVEDADDIQKNPSPVSAGSTSAPPSAGENP